MRIWQQRYFGLHYARYFTLLARSHTLDTMAMRALLLNRSQSGRTLLKDALSSMGVHLEACSGSQQAISRMTRKHYAAVIVDLDLPGADMVLRMARLAPLRKRPVAFAMLGSLGHIEAAFQHGANFVLYKPLDREQVVRSLRAGRGFMVGDRRRAERRPTEGLAYLGFDGQPPQPALLLDVTEDGVAIQAPLPLPASQDVSLRMVLPGQGTSVIGTAGVIWAEESGRAGLMFSYLEPASRRHLKAWLAKHNRQKHAPSAPGKQAAQKVAVAPAH